MESQQQGEQQTMLSSLKGISKQQYVMTTATVLGSLGIDLMTHFDAGSVFFGAVAIVLAARHGKDVLDLIVPGNDVAKVRETSARILDALSPAQVKTLQAQTQDDTATTSKLKRLVGLKTPAPAVLKTGHEIAPSEEVTEQLPAIEQDERPSPIFPLYPSDETIHMGKVVSTDQRFDPHIDAMFGKGLIASAVQGSGKSQLLGLIIEQAGKCGVPVIVFDHKGEYAPITALPFMHGLRAGAGTLKSKVTGAFIELNETTTDAFVAQVMSQRHQAIIHLPSYGDGWADRAAIVAEVGQALMRYAMKTRESGGLIVPCLVLLDEAQLYIPQNVNLLPPEAKKNADILDNLSNAYFALVSNGRSNGYTVGFATQSLTYIAKWAIKSCQIRIFGRHAEKNDLDMVESIINPNVARRADIETLQPGQAVVFGFSPQPMVVQFDRRQSRDDSETPGIERLRRKPAQPATQKQEITMEDILALLSQRPDTEPREGYEALIRRQEQEETRLHLVPSGNFQGNGHTAEMRASEASQTLRETGKGITGNNFTEALNTLSEPFPAIPEGVGNGPQLGKDDKTFSQSQEQDFLRRFRKTPDIQAVLKQMTNARGGIGLGNRYYKYAKWLVENKLAV